MDVNSWAMACLSTTVNILNIYRLSIIREWEIAENMRTAFSNSVQGVVLLLPFARSFTGAVYILVYVRGHGDEGSTMERLK